MSLHHRSAFLYCIILGKLTILLLIHLPLTLLCQAVIEGKWKTGYGVSTMSAFKRSSAFNLRYVSPTFRWTEDELTEEQEMRAEKFKKTRIMFELIYAAPVQNLCTGFNIQYRIWKYKRLSLDIYGGIKFFFIRGSDFAIKRPFVKGSSKGVWYINAGSILQLDLGIIKPYADIGYDGIVTVGTEFYLRKIYRKPKGRYKLHTTKHLQKAQ